jgi:hypothetical protein
MKALSLRNSDRKRRNDRTPSSSTPCDADTLWPEPFRDWPLYNGRKSRDLFLTDAKQLSGLCSSLGYFEPIAAG